MKMNRILSFFLICGLIFSFLPGTNACYASSDEANENISASDVETETEVPEFDALSDPALLRYVEDEVYTGLVDAFDSEDYIIEGIDAVYVSKEYLEEVAYNSQANIFFGYTLAELDEQFEDTGYVFTLGEDGTTDVQPFEDYDDTYDRVIKNVVIGSGVILTCVTVSAVSGAAGLITTQLVFAASADTAASFALSSALFSGVTAGVVKGYQTKDFSEAVKAAALTGSKSFKWGAITGAVLGGVSEAIVLRRQEQAVELLADSTRTWRESELAALEKYGGEEQVTFFEGGEVLRSTPGATRPDIVRTVDGHLEAIEVKNYNLENPGSVSVMYKELEREVSDRLTHLPEGTTQRIVLDVQGRGYSAETIADVFENIQTRLNSIYPNIPIELL